MIRVALIGARGYVGAELLRLLDVHPRTEVIAASSRQHAGKSVQSVVPEFSDSGLCFSELDPARVAALDPEVVFLALPNGLAAPFVEVLPGKTLIIDLSADYRFGDGWVYGQPERLATEIRGSRRIANPGCYATGMQLGLAPLVPELAETPAVFGVSGYSGAGTTPSRNNDPEVLRDNLLPYKLTGHIHEREVTRSLNHPVRFSPHVAAFFRGIQLTISGKLEVPRTAEELHSRFLAYYADKPLLRVRSTIPEVREAVARHFVTIGGFSVSESEPGHFVLCVTLDNLLKGAATQAVQNMNLALAAEHALDELDGIDYE